MKSTAQELWTMLKEAKHATVLTGAGISTLSGIPDFRGVGGLYSRKDIDANRLFDIHAFYQDPSYYYSQSRNFLYEEDARPNIVHDVLARLEKLHYLQAIITQNVDVLHQKAGSKEVFELHGSPFKHHCLDCRKEYSFEESLELMQKEVVPHCPLCNGVIKPDIVFFGEMLPEHALSMAQYHAENTDLMLILGTSLTVYPAADLPRIAHLSKAKLAIINASPTQYDNYADFHAKDLGNIFHALQDILDKEA